MTERALYSKLHDIILPLESKVGSGINTYKTQVRSGNYMSHETTNPLVVTIGWLIEEERVVQQLLELEAGSINIVQLSTLDFDELVHVQNIRARERGGFVNQWLVQGEFNLVGVKWHWMLDGEEVMTDWDNITWSAFIAGGGVVTEGNELPDTNCTWKCAIGSWQTPAEYLTCTLDSGFNHCIVVEAWGKDYPATADVIIQADVLNIWDDPSDVGLSIRNQNNGNLVNGSAYGFVMEISTDQFIFHKFTDASYTELKRWAVWPDKTAITLAYNTYYTLKVVARGNRFDCYCDGRYVGTVFDDTYRVGWHGLVSQAANIRADNFILKHAKPLVAHLPVGAYDWNQIRMSATERLNDDINACGLSRTVVAPDNPIEFRQWQNQLNNKNSVLLLPLEEGMGDPYDHSGNDNNGTINGALTWIDCDSDFNIEKCFRRTELAGGNLVVANDVSLSPDMNNFSVAIIVKAEELNSASNRHWAVQKYGNGSSTLGLTAEYSGGSWYWGSFLRDFDATQPTVITTTPIVIDQWYFVVLTFDRATQTAKIYVNGIEEVSVTNTGWDQFDLDDNADSWLLFGSIANQQWIGCIAYAEQLRECLTATEVLQRYDQLALNSPSGGEVKVWDTMGEDGLWNYLVAHIKYDEGSGASLYDSSKNNYTVSMLGTLTFSTDSYTKWAKTCFDGDGNSYQVVDLGTFEIKERTLGGWFKADDPTNRHDEYFSNYHAVDLRYSIMCWHAFDTDRIHVRVYNTIGGTFTFITDAGVVDPSQWHFVVVTWNYTTDSPLLYINGELIAWATEPTITGTPQDADDFRICRGGASYEFDGKADDGICFSKVLSADRIKWLYENMPRMVCEEGYESIVGWERVYDARHPFVGDMIVDNGLIRTFQYYKQPDDSYVYADKSMPTIYAYTDGMWEDGFRQWSRWVCNANYVSVYDEHVIKSIEKHKVVLSGFAKFDYPSDIGDWVRYEAYIVMGSPIVMFKMTDWGLSANLIAGPVHKCAFMNAVFGFDQSPRFAICSLDLVGDSAVDTNLSGTETEGLSMAFSTQQNLLELFMSESNINWFTAIATNRVNTQQCNNIDFDIKTPPAWWGMGLMAFDTSWLHCYADADSDAVPRDTWDKGTGLVEADAVHGKGATAGGYAIELDNTETCYHWFDPDQGERIPLGSYRTFFRLVADVSTRGVNLYVRNQDGGVTTFNRQLEVTNAWAWYFIDWILLPSDEGDNMRLNVTNNDGGGQVWVDQCVTIPAANGKNLPLDHRNHALMIPDITEIGG